MARYRLKHDHPTMIKLAKLMTYADELGIDLDFTVHRITVRDRDQKQEFIMSDVEGNIEYCFPPMTEHRLTYEK